MTAIAAAEQSAPPTNDRRLLLGVFAVLGLAMAVWGTRLPAVQSTAHLGPGQLSLVLLGAAAGMVAGLQLGGRLAHRHGPSRLLIVPAMVFGLGLALLGQCRTLPTLIAAAVVFGIAHGLLDVGCNASAVHCELAYQRPIMSGLHAAYSIGALCGAALAAVTTWMPHSVLFAMVGAFTVLAAVIAVPGVRASTSLDHAPQRPEAVPDKVKPAQTAHATVWLLGALAAACLLAEGAAADWSAVHLHSLHSSEATAAAAYALYSAAMSAGRLAGDRLTSRYGAPVLVRVGAALGAAGLGAALIAGSAPAALLGWMALGAGLSTAMPALITAAGRGGPRAVGTVASAGYLGLLAGPAAIGAIASLTSLTTALALPVVLAAAVALASYRALESR
ncbi:MFS transporter [Streptomyces sp. NBC_00582]|uniref:MFS transporter n=1 Tax=Streptomyces sp. NBC_00582 TaxID=2975783 RepID=UPI002E7FD4B8|nr:MFS transporter [Streptomyces sp. NBC_00582]WUB68364.1 MFS transporter [Streptomyces sp. NBC_00582]